MNFQTHNQKDVDVNGTSLIGYIDEDFAKIKKLFGKPSKGDGYKVDAEWEIEFEDGMVATIYNYKDGKNYLGNSGTPKTKIREWHIGGHNEDVLERIQNILNCVDENI
jgi:hypothetical protein